MTTIAEHTIDLSLLPTDRPAKIMDIGCRGFLFVDELIRLGHEVYPIDIDTLYPRWSYILAIAGSNGFCKVERSKDPQATRMMEGFEVPKYTIPAFSQFVGVPFWDVIKMDIEGAEYEVIMSLTEPPAKQLSIEFHLHTGLYSDKQITEMENKLLSLGYYPVKHDKYPAHGLQANYWDSLFILKD